MQHIGSINSRYPYRLLDLSIYWNKFKSCTNNTVNLISRLHEARNYSVYRNMDILRFSRRRVEIISTSCWLTTLYCRHILSLYKQKKLSLPHLPYTSRFTVCPGDMLNKALKINRRAPHPQTLNLKKFPVNQLIKISAPIGQSKQWVWPWFYEIKYLIRPHSIR